jgi:hypothetical protein
MAKRFVYQKGMHGYSDFVYVDLLPHVKRARQFNVNVIVALLVLIILTYVLVFVPYSDKLYQYEDLKAQNNDLTHELTLTNEEYIGYEINEDLINFEGNIDDVNGLKVDLKTILDDLEIDIQNNAGLLASFSYDADSSVIVIDVIMKDIANFSTLNTDFLGKDWVVYSVSEYKGIQGDGINRLSTFKLGVDNNAE